MRLEADDGRPETSPATTTRRSNGRSCSRARAASHPGRSGPSTTSRDRPRGAGIRTKAGVIRANTARYPISARCRMPGVPRSTYYWMTGHPGTERADCVSASWCPQYGHFFSSVGGWFPTETAPSEPAALFFLLSGHEGVLATVGAFLESGESSVVHGAVDRHVAELVDDREPRPGDLPRLRVEPPPFRAAQPHEQPGRGEEPDRYRAHAREPAQRDREMRLAGADGP